MTISPSSSAFPLPSGPAWTQPGEWPYFRGSTPALFVCGKIGPRLGCATAVCPYKFGHSGACQWERSFAPPAQPRRTEGLL